MGVAQGETPERPGRECRLGFARGTAALRKRDGGYEVMSWFNKSNREAVRSFGLPND